MSRWSPIKDSDGVGKDLLLPISRLSGPVDTVVPVLHHLGIVVYVLDLYFAHVHVLAVVIWSTKIYLVHSAHREGSSYEEDNNKGADTNEGEGGRWRDGVGRADAALVPGVGGQDVIQVVKNWDWK